MKHDPFNRKEKLFLEDVAVIWGQERARQQNLPLSQARPVSIATVKRYLQLSRPAPKGSKRKGKHLDQYVDNPVPEPQYPTAPTVYGELLISGHTPVWIPDAGKTMADVVKELRAWWHSRKGHGAPGEGRTVDRAPRRVRCDCGCGELVHRGYACARRLDLGRS